MGLLEGFQIGLTRGHKLLLMLVPVALEITDVILALLKQLVHLNVILGQDRASSFVVLLVT